MDKLWISVDKRRIAGGDFVDKRDRAYPRAQPGPRRRNEALKLGSKKHFYGRVAPEEVLAITYEKRPFYGRRAADASFSF